MQKFMHASIYISKVILKVKRILDFMHSPSEILLNLVNIIPFFYLRSNQMEWSFIPSFVFQTQKKVFF